MGDRVYRIYEFNANDEKIVYSFPQYRKHIRACVNVLWYIFYKKKKTCMHFVIGDKRDKYKKKKYIVTRRGKIQAYRLLANE